MLAILTDYADPDPSILSKLPKPTRRENPKGNCNVCGGYHGLPAVHLDYMGHADVTEALIKIDPFWSWEPFAVDQNGEPMIAFRGNTARMWARMTVLGKTLPAVGTCSSNKEELEKELIGDMLRNGALRFGIAVRLWSKADHEEQKNPTEVAPRQQSAPPSAPPERDTATEEAARAAAATDGSPAARLAELAPNGPVKARAVKAARQIAADTETAVPTSFEALLAADDTLIEGVIEQLSAAS